ncbi:peptide chain release factor 1-like, mitochondrial isoform X1 [Sinocyclocheilus anshuiensis]|uniref:Peptide chain release factor 1-like, mitochondrial n=2 Tax=Sinocyclocheilus anshuiensis TaxID=1608454 RepID=A0A671LHP8_9TELE|nr:PREDICTED: peptide chain release factor 1-like, mitochondrial isoform X1 [Sinocyclocheilus anshuiensis]
MAVVCFSKSLSCAGRQLLNGTLFRSVTRGSVCRCPVIHRTVNSTIPHAQRAFHTSQSVMVTKILSVEEIFNKRSLHDYLKKKEMEYNTCLQSLNTLDDEDVKMKRTNLSVLGPLVQKTKELGEKQKELEDTLGLLKENDPELLELAESEKEACLAAIQDLKQQILSLLIPEEESDMSDLVLEVTTGVGGQEAMLFTAEIFDMYHNFAAFHGWGFDILEVMSSELGGIRRAAASISGPFSYKKLKFEAGVHRVQRVPKTESKGRIHTSTMTVAILPQPTEISFTINPKDLRMETKRASGAGGQHVNTTDSAVRIVHLPTGTVAECQQERSQIKNKETAMTLLRAKLYSARLEEETSKRYLARKLQIGTKGRSEKIRTYNFSQDRITDHRIGKTIHDVHGFLQGEELLEEMIVFLQQFSEQESLMDVLQDSDQNQ